MANETVTPPSPPIIETVTVVASRPGNLLALALVIGFAVFVFYNIRSLKAGG